jgi:hypothetical protein
MVLLVKDDPTKHLVIPDFSSSAPLNNMYKNRDQHRIPFDFLFDVSIFRKNMQNQNIKISEELNDKFPTWQKGWDRLNSYQQDKKNNRLQKEYSELEKIFYKSLVPNKNSRWYKKMQKIIMSLNNKFNYGAIHPRIEKDWKIYSRTRFKNKSPKLSKTLEQINNSTLDKQMPVFISVGADIDDCDEKVLQKGITYSNSKIITLENRHSYDNSFAVNLENDETTYTEDSIISLWICRYANWFIGVPYSTFSRLIVKLRLYDNITTKWYISYEDEFVTVDGMTVPRPDGSLRQQNGFW